MSVFIEDIKRPICNVIFIQSDYRQLNVTFKIIVRQKRYDGYCATTKRCDDYRAFIVTAYDNRVQKTIIVVNHQCD